MTVVSVGGTNGNFTPQAVQRTPEAAEVRKAGGDHDGDADDGGTTAVKTAPAPSVNLNGQTVGQHIDVSA